MLHGLGLKVWDIEVIAIVMDKKGKAAAYKIIEGLKYLRLILR